jgi:RimJ/RimL family protein N-acetyltransferase
MRKLSLLTVTILPENRAMQRLLEHQGFRFKLDAENEVMKGQLALSEPRS